MTGRGLDVALLVAAVVLLVAIGAVRLSSRFGVPTLLAYLGIGLLLGQDGLGLKFSDFSLARDLGLIALALILAEGGLTTRWDDIRPTMPAAIALASVGVATSIASTALIAHLALGLGWRGSSLTAAVLASTDAAAVFATLRGLQLPRRLVGVLEAESGLNDAPTVIAVSLLAAHQTHSAGYVVLDLGYQLGAGAVIGIGVGVAAVAALRRAALPAAGLYPVATLALALTSYAAAASAGASGFLAVYLTMLRVGNASLPHRRTTVGFANGLAWLAQIGLFVMLGLLADPSRLAPAVLPGLALTAGVLLIARPLTVLVSTGWLGFGWRDLTMLSAAGLRGAVPIVLSTIPLTLGAPHARDLFDVVFVVVTVSTLLQAPALAPLARRLGIARDIAGRDLDVEAAPLDTVDADLLAVNVPVGSRLHGVEMWELRLPPGTMIVYIRRAGGGLVPGPATRAAEGDDLLIVTARSARTETERRLRAVSRSGRLARWVGDTGADETISPTRRKWRSPSRARAAPLPRPRPTRRR